MKFNVKALDQNGHEVKTSIEAETEAEAIKIARAQQLYPTSVESSDLDDDPHESFFHEKKQKKASKINTQKSSAEDIEIAALWLVIAISAVSAPTPILSFCAFLRSIWLISKFFKK